MGGKREKKKRASMTSTLTASQSASAGQSIDFLFPLLPVDARRERLQAEHQ
jgi:hypothetical protein